MGIYKTPTIYNQGLKIDDVIDSIKWYDITNKIGNFNSSVYNDAGKMTIKYSRTLRLLNIYGYGRSTTTISETKKIFIFNNNLPGDVDNRLFDTDTTAITRGSEYSPIIVSVRPYVWTQDTKQSNSVSIRFDSYTKNYVQVAGINVFLPINPNLQNQFDEYLNT